MWQISVLNCSQSLKKRSSKNYDNSNYSLCLVKLSQKNLVYVIIGFCFFFMGEPLSSIIAVSALAYFNPITRLGEERVAFLTNKLEVGVSKVSRSVTQEQANKNS